MWKCSICGKENHPFLRESSCCPYCGAHREEIVNPQLVKKLTSLMRAERALQEASEEVRKNLKCSHETGNGNCGDIDDCLHCSLLLILEGDV